MLPVAFDNQGGLAWTERGGQLTACAVASVQLFRFRVSVTVLVLVLKQNLWWFCGSVGWLEKSAWISVIG